MNVIEGIIALCRETEWKPSKAGDSLKWANTSLSVNRLAQTSYCAILNIYKYFIGPFFTIGEDQEFNSSEIWLIFPIFLHWPPEANI